MPGLTSLTTSHQIARGLESRIVEGDLAGGEKLPSERDLAKELGVSRPLVREALRALAERGLIVIAPGRGAFARTAQANDAALPLTALLRRQRVSPREVMEARLMVERDAASLAAQRAAPQDIEALRFAHASLHRSPNLIEQARWDVAFHRLIARASHNLVIETMFASITVPVMELMLRSLSDPAVVDQGLSLHEQIVDAITRGDADGARTAIDEHLGLAGRLYGSDYDSSLDAVARRGLEQAFGPSASLDHAIDLDAIQAAVDRATQAGEATQADA